MMIRLVCLSILIALLAGCAGDLYRREGLQLLEEGRIEEGLAKLEEAVREEPTNAAFRAELYSRRAEKIAQLLVAARNRRDAGKDDQAEELYKRVLRIEPDNAQAQGGIEAMLRERRYRPLIERATILFKKGDAEGALTLLRPVMEEDPKNADMLLLKRQIEEEQIKRHIAEPVFKLHYNKPISLEFRDANLKMVLDGLSRTTGVNFILDKDVRPDLTVSISLKQSTLEEAIELLLQANRLEKKVLNRNALLIYPNTPEKIKEYQEVAVKGFYIHNADVKQTQAMLKSMLKTKDIFIDEKINFLVMRDTPDVIRLAEKLIAMHDLSEPEVMLEVEVLEVKRTRLQDLGIQWPGQLTLTPLPAVGSALRLSDLDRLGSSRIGAALPNTVVKINRDTTDANLLANPRIRVRNREKAKIMVGDKVPVVTTTAAVSGGFVSESVQYLDVGLKLEVEPNIYLQGDVAIKVGMEVSNIVKQITTPGGSLVYQIGNRSANTVLRLKDGETQILAGLISDEDRKASSGIPGLGDLPVLGRLFASHQDDRQKTEIVLSITPRLVRNLNRPDAAAGEFWSGTEAMARVQPMRLSTSLGDSGHRAADKALAGSEEAGHGAGALKLDWQGPSQVKVGDRFKLVLIAQASADLTGLAFTLSYDAKALRLVEVTEEGFFRQGGTKTDVVRNIEDAQGKAFIGVYRDGLVGATGEGSIVTLNFEAIAARAETEIRLPSVSPAFAKGRKAEAALPPAFRLRIGD